MADVYDYALCSVRDMRAPPDDGSYACEHEQKCPHKLFHAEPPWIDVCEDSSDDAVTTRILPSGSVQSAAINRTNNQIIECSDRVSLRPEPNSSGREPAVAMIDEKLIIQ